MIELRWIFVGSLWAASLPKMGQTFRGCLVLFLLFQDLVTASIALEPGGLNYDLTHIKLNNYALHPFLPENIDIYQVMPVREISSY